MTQKKENRKIHIGDDKVDEVAKSLKKSGKAKIHLIGEFRVTRYKTKNNITKGPKKIKRISYRPSKALKERI